MIVGDYGYTVEKRSDNTYFIEKNKIQIFTLFNAVGQKLDIGLTYTRKDNQDNALRAWISTKPLDGQVKLTNSDVTFLPISRKGFTISLIETTYGAIPTNAYVKLPAGIYYLNIQNLENVDNNYYATFT